MRLSWGDGATKLLKNLGNGTPITETHDYVGAQTKQFTVTICVVEESGNPESDDEICTATCDGFENIEPIACKAACTQCPKVCTECAGACDNCDPKVEPEKL